MIDTIDTSSVSPYVESLRRFLTHEAMVLAQNSQGKRYRNGRLFEVVIMQEKQPLVPLFQFYDRLTMKGARNRRVWPREILPLVFMGRCVRLVTSNMPESVQKHHRDKLLSLDGQYDPVAHEWEHAYQFVRQGWSVAWYETHDSSPEFTVNSPHGEFDVECKWFGPDLSEKLKNSAAKVLFETLEHAFCQERMCGNIKINCLVDKLDHPNDWQQNFQVALRDEKNETFRWTLPGQLEIEGIVRKWNNPKYSEAELHAVKNEKTANARCFICAWKLNGQPANPLKISLTGTRMTDSELRDYIYGQMRNKVVGKFDGKKSAVLAFEFAGVDDVEIFRQSAGIGEIISRLFEEFTYLTAIIFRANRLYGRGRDNLYTSTISYVAVNESSYPEIAQAISRLCSRYTTRQ